MITSQFEIFSCNVVLEQNLHGTWSILQDRREIATLGVPADDTARRGENFQTRTIEQVFALVCQ